MQVTYVKLKPVLLALVLAAGARMASARAADVVLVAATTISEDKEQNAKESPNYVRPDPAAAKAAQDPKLAGRRKEMIRKCEDQRGVDCAKQVDTELGAEQLQTGGVRHYAPANKP